MAVARCDRAAGGEVFMVKELRIERERSKLDLEQITKLLDGGEAPTRTRRRTEGLMVNIEDPLFEREEDYFLTREDEYDERLRKFVRFAKIRRRLGEDSDYDWRNLGIKYGVSELVFMPTIELQGTEEQKAKWLPMARNCSITGCYAQTELGHGTYIRGLETTATYDPQTQEFVMHSPTLTSMKWWVGSLGHTATHTVVMARLIIRDKDYGIHAFIVQLRSLDDHHPLPGVEIGDIGPKFALDGIDNGFLRLTNVRIPRDQMLMKYSQVSPDGTYTKTPVEKVAYGSMVMLRVWLVFALARSLSIAVTIAVRYSVVRRQTQSRPGEAETQVMDYQTQQFKLLPLLATAYAMTLAGQTITKMYRQFLAEAAQGKFDSLPELHATCAGLKAFSTEMCSNGIDLCRLCCGGHGYSLASGLPTLYARMTSSQTYEGDNTVMLLQTARYLLKTFDQKLLKSQLPSNVMYLASDFVMNQTCAIKTMEEFSDPIALIEVYEHRVRRLVEIAAAQFKGGLESNQDLPAAWNNASVDLMTAARAHCHFVVLKSFLEALRTAELTNNNRSILNSLFALYGVFRIVRYSGEFAMDGYLSAEQLAMARSYFYELLKTVRKEAVPLVDAFDFPDAELNSVLGRYDGDVYTHLYKWAEKAPRNRDQIHPTYSKYLRKLFKSKI